MKLLSQSRLTNRAFCTFDVMDGSMKLPRQLQSLQPAHHRHVCTRPGANGRTIDDSFASQPVAETKLVLSRLTFIRIDALELARKVSLAAGRLTNCPEPQSFESMCLARAENFQARHGDHVQLPVSRTSLVATEAR